MTVHRCPVNPASVLVILVHECQPRSIVSAARAPEIVGSVGDRRRVRTSNASRASTKNTSDYRLTVSDPQTFSKAWTLATSVWRTDEEIYEAGCHERNIGPAAILAGARAQEKK